MPGHWQLRELAGAYAKWGVMGRFRPFERPLWSTFIWRPEFVNALDSPHDLSVYHIDDEYSFDETRVFLDHFFGRNPIRDVVDNPDRKDAFTSEVNDWGQKFVTLRENGPVYKVYMEKDRMASRIQ